MAEPVATLSLWAEDDVTVGDILQTIDALRRPEPMPPTRTAVLTLVIVARSQASADRAATAVHELGGRHPARVLTLVLATAGRGGAVEAGLDAEVRLLGSSAEGHEVWFEDVQLHVRGRVLGHLDSLIEPFTLPDLPVIVWFTDETPLVGDPLLTAADVLLVDARTLGDADCFATLAGLVGDHPVVDLSWVRLRPWRQLLGGLFEPPAFRPFVACVRHAVIDGHTGPRHLLGGWLADRLDLGAGTVELRAAEHVSLRLDCEDGAGRRATFEVLRAGDERVLRARADVDGGPTSAAVVRLPRSSAAWGLAEALAGLERDPAYERALIRAVG